MWLTNTATIAMLLPCVEAVLNTLQSSTKLHDDTYETSDMQDQIELQEVATDSKVTEYSDDDINKLRDENDVKFKRDEVTSKNFQNLAKALTLTTVYCSKAGGMATLTGTPLNVMIKGIIDEWWIHRGLEEGPITFPSWMVAGFPVSFLLLVSIICWFQIFYIGFRATLCPSHFSNKTVRTLLKRDKENLGKFKFKQWVVLVLFVLLVGFWFFRQPGFMPGWASNLKAGYITDAVPAIIVTFFLFIIPSELNHSAPPILD